MKKPIIKLFPNKKDDEDKAKLMEKFLNKEWKRYEDIIESISLARLEVEHTHNIHTIDHIWNKILKRVIEFDIKTLESIRESK